MYVYRKKKYYLRKKSVSVRNLLRLAAIHRNRVLQQTVDRIECRAGARENRVCCSCFFFFFSIHVDFRSKLNFQRLTRKTDSMRRQKGANTTGLYHYGDDIHLDSAWADNKPLSGKKKKN